MVPAREPGSLRVLTLNVWATGGDWPARRNAIRSGLEQLEPDLVALQETVLTDEYDQAGDLLADGYEILRSRTRDRNGMGITIASRWPVARTREIDLQTKPDLTEGFRPCALLAEVIGPAPIGRLVFVNHLPSWAVDAEVERERQAVMVVEAIEAFAEAPPHVVLAGDLDADPDAASIRFLTGRQSIGGRSVCYRDAWEKAHPDDPGDTFTPANPIVADPDWPFGRIDYVLVRCALHGGPTLGIRACERVFDQPIDGVWASDHFGLVADLEIPSR